MLFTVCEYTRGRVKMYHVSSCLWRSTHWLLRRQPGFCSQASICQFLSATVLILKFDISKCRFSVAFRYSKQAFPFLAQSCHQSIVATARNEMKNSGQEQTHSLSPSWQVHRWTLKFHPCDCQRLTGPWVTEKMFCPQGYVCILQQRWSSISSVLSAAMLSIIYTLNSFDFWDFATASLHITSFLSEKKLCKWISDFII